MTRITSIAFVLGLMAVSTSTQSALAVNPWSARAASINAAQYSQQLPWHGSYQYADWGTPVALVVPPTANMQTNYAWGVPSSRMTPIHHQWRRPDPGPTSGASHLPKTPYWPNDTAQFGVYPVRGPWNYHPQNPYAHQGLFGLCNGSGLRGCNGQSGLRGNHSGLRGKHGLGNCGCKSGNCGCKSGACGCNNGNCGCQSGNCTNCHTESYPSDAVESGVPTEAEESNDAPPADNGV